MSKNYNKKSVGSKIVSFILGVLLVLLFVGGLGFISKGFKDWNYKDWFNKGDDTTIVEDTLPNSNNKAFITIDMTELETWDDLYNSIVTNEEIRLEDFEILVIGEQTGYTATYPILFMNFTDFKFVFSYVTILCGYMEDENSEEYLNYEIALSYPVLDNPYLASKFSISGMSTNYNPQGNITLQNILEHSAYEMYSEWGNKVVGQDDFIVPAINVTNLMNFYNSITGTITIKGGSYNGWYNGIVLITWLPSYNSYNSHFVGTSVDFYNWYGYYTHLEEIDGEWWLSFIFNNEEFNYIFLSFDLTDGNGYPLYVENKLFSEVFGSDFIYENNGQYLGDCLNTIYH